MNDIELIKNAITAKKNPAPTPTQNHLKYQNN